MATSDLGIVLFASGDGSGSFTTPDGAAGTVRTLTEQHFLASPWFEAARVGQLFVTVSGAISAQMASAVVIDLRRSKTDQEGRGRVVAAQRLDPEFARFCPVSAVEAWLEVAQRESGPLFSGLKRNLAPKTTRLTEDHVGVVVRRVAAAGGLENCEEFGAHSLRAGYVTTARQQGVDWAAIMEQTGHRRLETVKLYARYTPDVFVATRVGDVFKSAFRSKA